MTILSVIVPACVAPYMARAFDIDPGRSLYTQCEENGRIVSISERCCEQIASLQRKFLFQERSCDQVNLEDFAIDGDKYCHTAPDGYTNCTYNVKQDNRDCADQIRDACRAEGGTIFSSDVTMQCNKFTLTLKNSLDCLGSSCNHNDVQEYLWTSAFTNHATLGDCHVAEINGQTIAQKKHDDAVSAAFGVLAVALFVSIFVAAKIFQRRRRMQTVHEPVPMVEISKSRASREVNGELA